jgi:hypothetical protein
MITATGAAVVTFDPTSIGTFEELQKIILQLKTGSRGAKVLSALWTPWRQPVPSLPIDKFITTLARRKRKPRLRSPDDLRSQRFGECPYAMARLGVAKAIEAATLNNSFEGLRTFTTSKLKDLKRELPALDLGLLNASNHIGAISASQVCYHELDLGNLLILQDRLLAALIAIRDSMPQIEALHLERSQHRGNLWRQRFVGSLFRIWWALTGNDPSSSSTPFLEFVEACWSSLSSNSLPEVSWESAIDSSLGRGSKSTTWWRETPPLVTVVASDSAALDAWSAGEPPGDF